MSVLFADKTKKPTAAELAKVLGPTSALWDELKRRIAAQHAPLAEEWVFSGKNYGWALRLKQKKRAVVYLKPCEGFFRASFAFGEKAALAAQQSDLPAATIELIDHAPRFAEGRGVRLEVRSAKDVGVVEKLAAVKMAN
jgi:hypothetical protein